MGIDLPHITGKVPWDVERAIKILRQELEASQAQSRDLAAAVSQLQPLTLDQIQQALAPTGSHPLPTAGLLNTTTANTNPIPPPPTPSPVPNHLDIVQAVLATHPLDASSTNGQIFRFAQQVAWDIKNLGTDPPGISVGLLYQTAGDGVFVCNGVPYATFRICYNNGANIKILTGSYTAQWTPEADVPLTDYRAPTDPAGPC